MPTVVAVLVVLLGSFVVIVAPLLLVEELQRRRARVIARQIRLTDAIHAELGALVAPVVEKHVFRPWRVIFPLSDGRTAEVGRLIAIADRVIGAELRAPSDLHIVFTRLAHA